MVHFFLYQRDFHHHLEIPFTLIIADPIVQVVVNMTFVFSHIFDLGSSGGARYSESRAHLFNCIDDAVGHSYQNCSFLCRFHLCESHLAHSYFLPHQFFQTYKLPSEWAYLGSYHPGFKKKNLKLSNE